MQQPVAATCRSDLSHRVYRPLQNAEVNNKIGRLRSGSLICSSMITELDNTMSFYQLIIKLQSPTKAEASVEKVFFIVIFKNTENSFQNES